MANIIMVSPAIGSLDQILTRTPGNYKMKPSMFLENLYNLVDVKSNNILLFRMQNM